MSRLIFCKRKQTTKNDLYFAIFYSIVGECFVKNPSWISLLAAAASATSAETVRLPVSTPIHLAASPRGRDRGGVSSSPAPPSQSEAKPLLPGAEKFLFLLFYCVLRGGRKTYSRNAREGGGYKVLAESLLACLPQPPPVSTSLPPPVAANFRQVPSRVTKEKKRERERLSQR